MTTPYDIAEAKGLLGVWIIARTPTDRKYPCRCSLGRRCTSRCWCNGRVDIDGLPGHCCGNTAKASK